MAKDNFICRNCGIEFIPKSKKAKYCSLKCRTRFNSRKNYQKKKDIPSYKHNRYAYFKKWLSENRLHFNEMMRKYSRRYQAKIKEFRLKNNLCICCGKAPPKEKRQSCENCLKKAVDYNRKYKQRQREKEMYAIIDFEKHQENKL